MGVATKYDALHCSRAALQVRRRGDSFNNRCRRVREGRFWRETGLFLP